MTAPLPRARPASVGTMLATSAWLVLVLVGLQTAWVGFFVAAGLVRRAWWRLVAVLAALTSIAMWPAHDGPWFATGHFDDSELGRIYLVTWTVLCLVAFVLNTRVLTARRERALARGTAPARHRPETSQAAPPEDRYFYSTATHRVEQHPGAGSPDLMGPYPTREAAEHALETARARTQTWDDEDEAWGRPAPAPEEPSRRPSPPDPAPDTPAWGSADPATTPLVEPPVQDRVDVNTAPVRLLRTLPGVTRAGARQAVAHRQLVGGFSTVDDFAWTVGVHGPDRDRLRDRASCSPLVPDVTRRPRHFGR